MKFNDFSSIYYHSFLMFFLKIVDLNLKLTIKALQLLEMRKENPPYLSKIGKKITLNT